MFCIHCGAEISDFAKFCPECGKALTQGTPNISINPRHQRESPASSGADAFIGKSSTEDLGKKKKKTRKRKSNKRWLLLAAIAAVFLFWMIGSLNRESNGTNAQEEMTDTLSEAAADPAGVSENSPETKSTDVVSENGTELEEPAMNPAADTVAESDVDSEGKAGSDTDHAVKIEGPAPAVDEKSTVTPLSDFWVGLADDHTITLRSFDTHDHACIIPSEYIVDGEQWQVRHVGEACFFGRTSLEYLVIPEGVETIAHNAFNSCAIETFYFPSTLRDITGIFEYLEHGNKTIYYAGDVDDWWAITGADGLTENIEVFANTAVPVAVDDTNYISAELTTEKSEAEQLGESVGNAFNGIFQGFNDAMEEDLEK